MATILARQSNFFLRRCGCSSFQLPSSKIHRNSPPSVPPRRYKESSSRFDRQDSFVRSKTRKFRAVNEAGLDDDHADVDDDNEGSASSSPQTTARRRPAILAESDDRNTLTNENGMKWKVLGTKDYGFIKLMVQMKGRRAEREKLNKILLEGKRLITEGLTSNLKLHSLFFVDPISLNDLPLIRGEGELFQISQERMNAWSDMDHGPGIFAIVEKPNNNFVAERQSMIKIPLTAIVDGLKDPGNFGAVIRTLAAVGCEKIIILPGTCDAWQPTVLRGGMGAHFSIPIHQYVGWEFVRSYLPDDFNVFLADSNSYEVIREAESMKTQQPSRGRTATVHLAFDSKRNRKVIVDNELMRPDQMYSTIQLPVVDLYRTDFTKLNHIALIIGGETSGLSSAAYQFAHKYDGIRCHVPMSNGMNSLNVATATGIIAYEMKRQFSYSPKISPEDDIGDENTDSNGNETKIEYDELGKL